MNNDNHLNCEKQIVGIMGIVEPSQNALGIEIMKFGLNTGPVSPSMHSLSTFL